MCPPDADVTILKAKEYYGTASKHEEDNVKKISMFSEK